MTNAEFVELCERLRALGATEVQAGDMRASFGPATSRRPAPKPESPVAPSFATPEQAERWRDRVQGR